MPVSLRGAATHRTPAVGATAGVRGSGNQAAELLLAEPEVLLADEDEEPVDDVPDDDFVSEPEPDDEESDELVEEEEDFAGLLLDDAPRLSLR
ncbi:hypothetical protein GCM10017688_55580 [Streptomyces ramulosus]